MKLTIKQFDTSLPLPAYKTAGAAAFDLYARIEVTIPAHGVGYVPLNIAVQLPPNYWAQISARSSLHKRGLLVVNGIGICDEDYSGNDDEYLAPLLNFTDKPVTVERGERVVQMMVLRRNPIEFEVVTEFPDAKNRGGFGTTGRHG